MDIGAAGGVDKVDETTSSRPGTRAGVPSVDDDGNGAAAAAAPHTEAIHPIVVS